MDVLTAGHAVAGGQHNGIRQVQACQLYGRFGQADTRFVLIQTVGLFILYQRSRAAGTEYLLVACLGGIVSGAHVVVLLTGDGILAQQFLVAGQFAAGILHLHAGFLDACIAHTQVVLRGGNACRSGLAACQRIGKVGLGLCQTQAELSIFDDDQRVALVHGLELLKADALDEALYAGIHGGDVLLHLCVVGIFYTTQVQEARADVSQSCHEAADDDDVVYQFLCSSCNHDFKYYGLLNI